MLGSIPRNVTAVAGDEGADGAAGAAGGATAGAGVARATTVGFELAGADDRLLPVVPVTAVVEAAAGISMRCSTRSLICVVTTCMRWVNSPVSISVSCCAATCSARRLLVYE